MLECMVTGWSVENLGATEAAEASTPEPSEV